jgi:hypothetical protein
VKNYCFLVDSPDAPDNKKSPPRADNIRKFVVSAGNAKRKKLPIPIGTGSFSFDNPTDYPPKSPK